MVRAAPRSLLEPRALSIAWRVVNSLRVRRRAWRPDRPLRPLDRVVRWTLP